MQKITIDIIKNKAILKSDNKIKEIDKCNDELDAVIRALQEIKVPCKIIMSCSHPAIEKLIKEIDKSVHNINELAENCDKWKIVSILILMKKIRNISLT